MLTIAAWSLGAVGLFAPADPVGTAALWAWAEDVSQGEPSHALWIAACGEAARLRPWHVNWGEARWRRAAVEQARLRALHRSGAG